MNQDTKTLGKLLWEGSIAQHRLLVSMSEALTHAGIHVNGMAEDIANSRNLIEESREHLINSWLYSRSELNNIFPERPKD